jgi:hypothetical protein
MRARGLGAGQASGRRVALASYSPAFHHRPSCRVGFHSGGVHCTALQCALHCIAPDIWIPPKWEEILWARCSAQWESALLFWPLMKESELHYKKHFGAQGLPFLV